MRRVYLLRHGRPDVPANMRMCLGRTDIPLGPLGRMQALLLARALEGKVSHVFSSPLARARQTAEAFGREVTVLEGLTELSAGDWDGLDFSEIARRWPELYAARGEDPNLPIPGAEDAAQGQTRFVSAVLEALEHSEGDIAIAAHISVNQLLLCQSLGISPYLSRQFRLPCGSCCILSWDSCFKVHAIGQLPQLPLTPRLAEELLLAAAPGQRVVDHSRAVASEALRIARAMPAALDLALLESAALLHDVARSCHDHPSVGAAWLGELGYDRAAHLIGLHHDYEGTGLDEAALLYIADKLVKEDRPVRLTERFSASGARCTTAEARAAHRRRFDTAMEIKNKINGCCGRTIIE